MGQPKPLMPGHIRPRAAIFDYSRPLGLTASHEWGDERLPERYWDYVHPEPNTGCWLWGGLVLPNGYGTVFAGPHRHSPRQYVHRVSYSALVAAIPAKLQVDHLCRVRWCVRPEHLEAVTQAENIRRGVTGQRRRELMSARHECGSGHALTDDNVYIVPGHPTWRQCRTCKAENDRARRLRRQQAAAGASPPMRTHESVTLRLVKLPPTASA